MLASTFGMVLTDSSGNQYFVEANPGFVSLTGSNTISHGLATTSAANTSTSLPSTTGNSVRITALVSNTKNVYVGSASQGVTNASYGDCLRAGDSVVYNVTNADLLAIATDVSGEGVSYVVTN